MFTRNIIKPSSFTVLQVADQSTNQFNAESIIAINDREAAVSRTTLIELSFKFLMTIKYYY